MLQRQQLDAKVRQYEAFVNDVLKADLKRANEVRARHEAELQEWKKLETDVAMLHKEGMHEVKTQVDLGCDVMCQAHVPDTSRIYLSVGLGFHVEATLSEAPRIIALRTAPLEAKIKEARDKAARIKAHIKFVEEAIRELLQLPRE